MVVIVIGDFPNILSVGGDVMCYIYVYVWIKSEWLK